MWIAYNGRAFCCAGILCSVSRQLKPIEKLQLKLCKKLIVIIWPEPKMIVAKRSGHIRQPA
jgi:hypothetical protein